MPDNVAITAGSGTSIATDDVSSVHYQRVKLDVGGNGLAVPIEHTEAMLPVGGHLSAQVTNTRTGTLGANDDLSVTVPTDAKTLIYTRRVTAGSPNALSFQVLGSFDGGNTYRLLPFRMFILGSSASPGATGAYLTNMGGYGGEFELECNVTGCTHLKLRNGNSLVSPGVIEEKYRFNFEQSWLQIDSGGVAVTSAIDAQGGSITSTSHYTIGAYSRSSELAANEDNNWTAQLMMDKARRLTVHPYHIPQQTVRGNTAAMTGTASTQLLAAAGSGIRNYLTTLTWSNTSAVDTEVNILDGSTVIWTFYAKAQSGGNIEWPMPLRGSANTALNVQNLTTASSVKVSGNGFKSAA